MQCHYCRKEIDDEATVCPYCRAFAVETREEILWYREGERPPGGHPWLAAILVVVTLLMVLAFLDAQRDADRKAEELFECVVAGQDDCD